MTSAYPVAFLVGVLSSMHCVGMCGGIVGALTWSQPAETRAHAGRVLGVLLALNLGRIGSYAVAGALFGWAGSALAGASGAVWIGLALRSLAALVLVGIGLYLGGWFPRMAAFERLGAPLWSRLTRLANRLIPIRGLGPAALYGVLWGWLPCGLVYTMLIGAPAQDGALSGATYMALFGSGTLPVTLGGGLLAGRLFAFARDRRYRTAAGLLVVALGLSMLLMQGYNEWS
jgi:uncharacterized protein